MATTHGRNCKWQFAGSVPSPNTNLANGVSSPEKYATFEKRLSKCSREINVPREGDSDERAGHKVEEIINHNAEPYVPERLHLLGV